MNTKSHIIAVDIELAAPMTISAAEKGRYDFEQGKFVYGEQGVMCGLTRKQSLFGTNEKVPVIPASTISGRLRRAAAELIQDAWVAREITCSPDVVNMMMTGSATTELKTPTIASRLACRADAFMRNFGGSTFMEHADSVIGIGWPILTKTARFHMTEPLLAATDDAEEKKVPLTEVMAIVKKDDVQDMSVKNQHALIGEEALARYFAKVSGDKVKRLAAKDKEGGEEDAGKTSLRTFNGFEVVRTGTRFAIRVKVGSPASAHLGLMLLAMQSMLREGNIGGKASKGLGWFNVEASRLIEIDEETRQTVALAKLFEGKETGYALAESDIIQKALEDATDYIQNADVAFFEAIATGNTDFFEVKKAA